MRSARAFSRSSNRAAMKKLWLALAAASLNSSNAETGAASRQPTSILSEDSGINTAVISLRSAIMSGLRPPWSSTARATQSGNTNPSCGHGKTLQTSFLEGSVRPSGARSEDRIPLWLSRIMPGALRRQRPNIRRKREPVRQRKSETAPSTSYGRFDGAHAQAIRLPLVSGLPAKCSSMRRLTLSHGVSRSTPRIGRRVASLQNTLTARSTRCLDPTGKGPANGRFGS